MKDGQLSGKAAPNTYRAPYTVGQGNSLTIQPPIVTRIGIYDPEYLKEQDYLNYLTRVKSYSETANRLELTGADENGRNIVMVYAK
jgi:heat shock protein HslJ